MSDSEMIRCTSCKGAKQVPKLGGMMGDCNACEGKGKIKASERVKVALSSEPAPEVGSIISAVAKAVPVKAIEIKSESAPSEPVEAIKVDGKRAIYKRKKA